MLPDKTVTATEFKSGCLKLIDAMNKDGRAVTVTRHGKPVARLVPAEPAGKRPSIIGSMKGTVLRYDDPFVPAIDPSEWEAMK